MLETRCYRINGVVQGVGFRPHAHKLAIENNLNGWILNDSEGVLLEVQGLTANLNSFIDRLKNYPPPLSIITHITRQMVADSTVNYNSFEIRKSVSCKDTKTIVPPDSFVCDDCIAEMRNVSNRRFRYPFINCTNCGPRYSIIEKMPYDRPMTTMKRFKMCPDCEAEYHDIGDRRYHAQPNACPVCGPMLQYTDTTGRPVACQDIVRQAIVHLKHGKIIAVKSIGGFHLAVDAHNESAIKLLRTRKRRDAKPFALMADSIDIVRRYAVVASEDERILNSPQRPIVLLKKIAGTLPDAVAPYNPNLGFMLASAPLHYLLLEDPDLPVLIMTSANISGHPIVFENEKALLQLASIADYFLMNNRDIYTRVDDSVLRISTTSPGESVTTILRRSKGYAPFPIKVQDEMMPILALGAELKNVIAISKGNDVFLSQHIGDLKKDENFASLSGCARHLQSLLDIEPTAVGIDMHPQFRHSVYMEDYSTLPVVRVQHHHAHMASCMVDNAIDKMVIGAIFDGTGYGTDKTIWGGEFLVGNFKGFSRAGHIFPFYLIGGDKAVEEPFRTAISLLFTTFGEETQKLDLPIYEFLSKESVHVFLKIAMGKINCFKTTSMGRLFDGISSLIGLCHKITYEAQAAIELEGLLDKNPAMLPPLEYAISEVDGCYVFDHRPMVRNLIDLIMEGEKTKNELSRMFHSTVVDATANICRRIAEDMDIPEIVLSGGVYMNEYLLCNTMSELKKRGLHAYCHKSAPANDGGIALGQIAIVNAQLKDK